MIKFMNLIGYPVYSAKYCILSQVALHAPYDANYFMCQTGVIRTADKLSDTTTEMNLLLSGL